MWYDTLKGMPEPGGLREAVAVYVWQRRKDEDLQRWLLLYQGLGVESRRYKKIAEVLTCYAFPFAERYTEKDQQRVRKVVENWCQLGPLAIDTRKRGGHVDVRRPGPGRLRVPGRSTRS